MEVFYRLLYVAFWSGWRCSLDELWRKCCLREHSNNRNPALHVCSCKIVAGFFFMTQILQVEAMVPVMTLVNRLVRWMAVHLCRNSGKVILMLFAEGKPFSAVTLPKCYCFRFFLPEVGQWCHFWGEDLTPCSWKRWFCNSVQCITIGYCCFILCSSSWRNSPLEIETFCLFHVLSWVSIPLPAALSPLGGSNSFWLAVAQSSP